MSAAPSQKTGVGGGVLARPGKVTFSWCPVGIFLSRNTEHVTAATWTDRNLEDAPVSEASVTVLKPVSSHLFPQHINEGVNNLDMREQLVYIQHCSEFQGPSGCVWDASCKSNDAVAGSNNALI